MKTQTIKPNIACEICHGTGEVTDWVDYGSTVAGMDSFCSCVEVQADEDTDEIILDCSEMIASMGGNDSEPEAETVYAKYRNIYDAR